MSGGDYPARHGRIDRCGCPTPSRTSSAATQPSGRAPTAASAGAAATSASRLRLGAWPLGLERTPRPLGLGVGPLGPPQRPVVGGRTQPTLRPACQQGLTGECGRNQGRSGCEQQHAPAAGRELDEEAESKQDSDEAHGSRALDQPVDVERGACPNVPTVRSKEPFRGFASLVS